MISKGMDDAGLNEVFGPRGSAAQRQGITVQTRQLRLEEPANICHRTLSVGFIGAREQLWQPIAPHLIADRARQCFDLDQPVSRLRPRTDAPVGQYVLKAVAR